MRRVTPPRLLAALLTVLVGTLLVLPVGAQSRIARGFYFNTLGQANGNVDLGAFSLLLGSALGTNDVRCRRTSAVTLTCDDAAGGSVTIAITGALTATGNVTAGATGRVAFSGSSSWAAPANGIIRLQNTAETRGLDFQASGIPSCTSGCGTSPSYVGVDSSFTVTMGSTGTPASEFVVAFAASWGSAPQCTPTMGKAGMVVGKLPLTVVTSTTRMEINTNGTAPSTSDVYHVRCSRGI